MERPGTPERDEREVARVVATLDRDEADGFRHQRLGDADDAGGGLLNGQVERRRDRLERSLRRVRVELDDALSEVLGDDP